MSEIIEKPTRSPYWGGWATFGFGIAVFATYLVIGVFLGVILGIVLLATNPGTTQQDITNFVSNNEGIIAAISTYATTVIGLGFIAIFVKARNSLSIPQYLGFRAIRLKTALILVAVTVGLLLLSFGLGELFHIQSSGFDVRIYQTSKWPPLLWIALVVCAPLFEEAFFRGFLYEGFSRSKLGIPLTIVITASAWAVLHVQYGFYEIGSIFVLGVVLGIVRNRTNSLWSPMIIHASWNLAAVIQLALTTS